MMSSKQEWFIEKLQNELNGNESKFVTEPVDYYSTSSNEASAIIKALLVLKNGGSNDEAADAWLKKSNPGAYKQAVQFGLVK